MAPPQSDKSLLERELLSEFDRDVLRRTTQSRSDFLRASRVARKNGMTYIVFGILTLVLSYGNDLAGLGLGAALVGLGLNARTWGQRLAIAEPSAPSRLALGEIGLLAAVVIYSVAKMTIMKTPMSELSMLMSTVPGNIDVDALADSVTDVVYLVVMLVAFLYQGGLALYYRARRSAVRHYLEDTPEWAREIVAIVAV
jgi:hypothetical protein